ncbi:DNA cytosine methyltransferase [Pseudomonas sp. C11]|uniref:DNA cytosine methyltransferase n=1 Tax=Pseudomonas sp. C11 TaxID=3075550 RepID=UPI002AFE3DB5|nr:DNA cytosine methyltransferase [Pseudomonas sp. C11]
MITYGSICSGIEAATVAWHPLGWRAEWFAEIEPFPSAVLAYRWPEVSNLGDMTKLARQVLAGTITAPDVLVGGTPCQAFSVAGMRAGLDDPRGQLTIKYVELADAVDHVRPAGDECIVVWENVPGVLSDKGNAFGCFLGALVGESDALQPSGGKWTDAGCVYGPRRTVAWRVLDAQYFGLAQRRRRVFVVASARAGFDPAAVLFESEGVRRDHPPRRGQGQDLTGHAPFRPALQCGCGCTFDEQLGSYGCPNCEGDEGPAVSVIAGIPAYGGHSLGGSVEQAATLTAKDTRMDMESETFFVAPTIAGGGQKAGGYSYDDIPITAGTLTREAFSGGLGGRPEGAAAGHFIVAATLDASYGRLQGCSGQDANHGHSHLVVHGTQDPDVLNDQAHPLGRNHGQENAVIAFDTTQITCPTCRSNPQPGDPCHTLSASQHPPALVSSAVRRLTPRECERLQGFPDDYTLIPTWDGWRRMDAAETPEQCLADGLDIRQAKKSKRWYVKDADGPRYKAIGNSKAVPVVRWIGRRIQRELERAQ